MMRRRLPGQMLPIALGALWAAALGGVTVLTGCADTGTARTGPSNVTDLVGGRAQSLYSEMSWLGYSHVGGYTSGTASITTWWNPTSGQCVGIETREGRVSATESDFEGNCR